MRNLIHSKDSELETKPVMRIPRQARPLGTRDFTRHIREAGLKQRTLHIRVARAMKRAAV